MELLKTHAIIILNCMRKHATACLEQLYRAKFYFINKVKNAPADAQFRKRLFQCSFSVNELKSARISSLKFYIIKKVKNGHALA